MSANSLVPTIEKRLGAMFESARRIDVEKYAEIKSRRIRPAITISREFGCEAYPVSECLQKLMEQKTGESWLIMDKALLDEVARKHDLSEIVLKGLGDKSGFLDEIIATFSPAWRTDKDYYRLLCRQIISLASSGNVIIVGRGSAIITQSMKNCYHFRLFATLKFKTGSIARRMEISEADAEKMILQKQRQRDAFIKSFLNQDVNDLSFYDLIFNNDRNLSDKIATTIANYVLAEF